MARRNLLEILTEYLDGRYPKRSMYAKGAALGVLAAVAANSCRTHISTPGNHKTNLYVLIIGPSTTGKSSMVNYAADLLDSIGYRSIVTDDITPETFPKMLREHRFALMRINEMSKMLGSYKKKQYMAGLREMLIQAWDGTPLVQSRAGRDSVGVMDYAFSAIADSQPAAISDAADEIDVQSGFLPRFIFFYEPAPPRIPPSIMSDDQIATRLELISRLERLYEISQKNLISFKFTQDQVNRVFQAMHASAPPEYYMFQPFYDRITDFVYKLSMLHMISNDAFIETAEPTDDSHTDWTTRVINEKTKHEITVTMNNGSLEWAIEFAHDYLDNTIPRILRILKLNDGEKVKDAVTRYQEEHEGKNIPESILYRMLAHGLKGDGNRIRQAIELAKKMDYVKFHVATSGRSFSVLKQQETSIDDFAHEQVGEEDEMP